MTTQKVTLTKPQADAVQYALEAYNNNPEEVVYYHVAPGGNWIWPALNEIPLQSLVLALYVGYDVEEPEPTPEERIRAKYEEICREYTDSVIRDRRAGALFAHGYRVGLVYVLDTLGIKIDGVNTEGVSA